MYSLLWAGPSTTQGATTNPLSPQIDVAMESTANFIEELSGPKTGKVQRLGATWNLANLPTVVRERYDMVLARKPIPVALLETPYELFQAVEKVTAMAAALLNGFYPPTHLPIYPQRQYEQHQQ